MKVADLTLTIYEGMPCFPVKWYIKPKFDDILHVDNDPSGSHRYASQALLFNHGGTHLDSPKHFNYFDAKKTIDLVPVDTLVNDTIWVHLEKKDLEPITADDLIKGTEGIAVKGKNLLATTGYTDTRWGTDNYFQASPYLGVDAAEWIVKEGIKMVAIDFQTDKPGDAAFPVHNTLLSHEVYILEYINNVHELLDKKFPREFILSVGVLKLKGCEAATARVFAIEK